ncbi:MAG: hypothetical protein ACI8RD_014028 [Bacillariaceae sp.]|jgi:hypothetical protein
MDQIASKAKSTVKSIPQKIGRTILSVPTLLKQQQQQQQQRQQQNNELDDDDDDDPELFIGNNNKNKHAFVCSNIIEDQNVRQAVRESQLQCLQEIIDHLHLYLFENTETNSYEGWIASLHPDNVKDNNGTSSGNGNGSARISTSTSNIDSSGSGVREIIIDHRFYMKDSHHRQLWNEYMEKLECRESTVEGNRSIEPTHTIRSLLSEANNDMLGMDSWFFPL